MENREITLCKCKSCDKEFEPYECDDDCYPCRGDGDYETEDFDGSDIIIACPFCKGKGSISHMETKTCKNCKPNFNDAFDDDEL